MDPNQSQEIGFLLNGCQQDRKSVLKKTRKEISPRAPSKASTVSSPANVSPGPGKAALRVVGMGGSAGGLEAFEQFFSHMPPDTGVAFVLVPHLEPTHKGMMPELLGRHTAMRVVEAEDGMEIQPNRVYVIPPNADLAILHGKLQVLEPVARRGLRMPIDLFFRHLAADQKEKAISIILSGMGSDGTLGLKAIKENLGMVMVQDPSSAKYDGMPRSAINTGLVDYVAPAEDLPAKLIQYVSHPRRLTEDHDPSENESSPALQKAFVLLRAHTGNDFSCYKNGTISRRIERRMSVHQFDSLPRYVRFLQENPQEVELLYKELLIGVTNFFRDPGLFDVLKERAIPQWLQDRPKDGPIRVWNPGCSSGEETYSLAIVLKECMEELHEDHPIQLFATDIDNDSIERARQGIFAANIASDVSAERLARFFVPEGEGYRIKREIRDLVIFAPQNILVDPPFTKLDIVCCRNLLIYVNAETQKKILVLMHYALNPDGLLILGSAESVGSLARLYSPLDQKWKVFQRMEVQERNLLEMPSNMLRHERTTKPLTEKDTEPTMDIFYATQRFLLDLYGPPSVVVTAEGDIVYINGRTGKFLEPSSGKVNLNIFAMAREGLREELGVAIHKAAKQKSSVIQSGVKVKFNGGWTTINLLVKPIAESAELHGMFLVVFEETAIGQAELAAERKPASSGTSIPRTEVEDELRRMRERLQTAIEEMQATQEELRSANEELQSNNEELQSTNEELTSSKEELQSLNEEMQTVNAELQSKIEELSQSNSDMKNLLNGIEIATIFLDGDLCIKRFTAQASRVVNLVAGDVGRPIGHFTTNLKYDRLVQDAKEVLDTLIPKEVQVQASDARWYIMRVLPYRTADNVIDGVVMTFSDTTALKQTETQLQEARDFARSIIATIREPLVVLDGELRILTASHSFYQKFQVKPVETEGRLFYEIGQQQWEISSLRQLLTDILLNGTTFEDFRVEYNSPTIGHKALLLNGRKIAQEGRQPGLILLAMEDVTASLSAPEQV
jgi:two-component system, chemotaxis family, CheB/CheR fusion protein